MKNKKVIKRIVLILSVILIVLLGVDIFAGNFMVNYAIGRMGDGGNRTVSLDVNEEKVNSVKSEKDKNIEAQKERTKLFWDTIQEEVIFITSDDNLKLRGAFYENESGHNYAIVIHGYRSNHYGMLDFSERYFSEGFHVVAPDLRGCGESEGNFVGMGWPDRLDILKWIDWIIERDPEAKIVIHGISMGGATTMMTSGEPTPDEVVCFVEDCGYTSVSH